MGWCKMASINGVEMKSLKYRSGHEDERLSSGIVYFNGKKVGYVEELDYGGGLQYELPDEAKEKLMEYGKKNFHEDYLKDLDFLFYHLMDILETEKKFKTLKKKSPEGIIFITSFLEEYKHSLFDDVTNKANEYSYTGTAEELLKKYPEYKAENVKIFEKLEDFHLIA